jgi:hypothetical protein
MKNLLTLTAISEFITGLLLVVLPSKLVSLLLGSTLDTPGAITVARMAGVALIALGSACWIARKDTGNNPAKGLVVAMLAYNVGITIVLVHAKLSLSLSGIGLWPVVVAHLAMATWCFLSLQKRTIS